MEDFPASHVRLPEGTGNSWGKTMVLYGFYMVLYGFIWFYMVLYGFIWFYMVLHDFI